jgi:hypothetical protein
MNAIRERLRLAVASLGVLLFCAVGCASPPSEETNYGTVQTTFQGLSRDEAYGRLRAMRLVAIGWNDPDDRHIVSNPQLYLVPFPAGGDVEIEFEHIPRKAPRGHCGASARTVLHFKDNRVARVVEGTTLAPCPH